MAERLVSPAVFTNEIDSTYLVQGISEIGGAVVGPFSKGPAYSPTIVRSVQELEDLFGVAEGKYYQPYTAREYLLQQGVVTIVRVGALEGWKVENPLILTAEYISGSLGAIQDDDGITPNFETPNPVVDRYGQPLTEGDMPAPGEKVLIGVLANTLEEIDRESFEVIARGDLAEPEITSIGFTGSAFEIVDESGSTTTSRSVEVSYDSPTATLLLRSEFNTQDNPTGNDEGIAMDLGKFTFHMNTKDADSIQNVFGRSAQKNVKPAYFESYFEDTQAKLWNYMTCGARFNLTIDTTNQDALNFKENMTHSQVAYINLNIYQNIRLFFWKKLIVSG